jgi:hypothetical protein
MFEYLASAYRELASYEFGVSTGLRDLKEGYAAGLEENIKAAQQILLGREKQYPVDLKVAIQAWRDGDTSVKKLAARFQIPLYRAIVLYKQLVDQPGTLCAPETLQK